MPSSVRPLVIVPTYDEAENITAVTERVLGVVPEAHLLVVDDGSPDGTADIVAAIAAGDDRVHLMRRSGKLGLGTAYVAGFRWGIERGYDLLVEMDADGSHPASALPDLVRAVADAPAGARVDLAIGSRWVTGGSVVDWPRSRELLSRGGNWYARWMLRLDVHDITAGFRVYRADAISQMDLDTIDSKGYCFQVDMTLRVHDAGGRIVERPIEFRDRVLGTSKMSRAIVLEAMARVTQWGLQRRFGRRRR
ncbi:dolichol-phosphate mannosyltransferase [Curtobacterium sp. MCBD17_034]|uniref:polyprenol monophosphomannose synthase n=1 Tax=unclassified Curtobacterium TaxID=257496 RepID=UPI000DA97180|nr:MULTISPECIES: polyprenol monophosphomannose synthase [unclassified Curtobacterium]PZF58679.1 dolichol-phosphate mannosyltransferase [Curtobacterium sp. MCBD17_034]PZF64535.1 dolichol-phosphate mannosyltransferase [Curtobacterium sp. MCBD17_013]PZM34669.1 dolichol-phosphate mannosyltransferase [Curtobacterium sp. MCBD17_031]WIB66392.1 polyprenol monophosphomannose synthase [Curtobacterium sp. MCBD17_035]